MTEEEKAAAEAAASVQRFIDARNTESNCGNAFVQAAPKMPEPTGDILADFIARAQAIRDARPSPLFPKR